MVLILFILAAHKLVWAVNLLFQVLLRAFGFKWCEGIVLGGFERSVMSLCTLFMGNRWDLVVFIFMVRMFVGVTISDQYRYSVNFGNKYFA